MKTFQDFLNESIESTNPRAEWDILARAETLARDTTTEGLGVWEYDYESLHRRAIEMSEDYLAIAQEKDSRAAEEYLNSMAEILHEAACYETFGRVLMETDADRLQEYFLENYGIAEKAIVVMDYETRVIYPSPHYTRRKILADICRDADDSDSITIAECELQECRSWRAAFLADTHNYAGGILADALVAAIWHIEGWPTHVSPEFIQDSDSARYYIILGWKELGCSNV